MHVQEQKHYKSPRNDAPKWLLPFYMVILNIVTSHGHPPLLSIFPEQIVYCHENPPEALLIIALPRTASSFGAVIAQPW